MAAKGEVFVVAMGDDRYSLYAPDGTPGEPAPYEAPACVMWNKRLYYTLVEDPEDFPEGGQAPPVWIVMATEVVESSMEEVNESICPTCDGTGVVDGDEEEEDEEDGGEPGAGDVIEFPEIEEEEDDENLPRAE